MLVGWFDTGKLCSIRLKIKLDTARASSRQEILSLGQELDCHLSIGPDFTTSPLVQLGLAPEQLSPHHVQSVEHWKVDKPFLLPSKPRL